MASGPYQSNLLRFLVGQYHQGINRHRQAVRKTRTQAELSMQVGAVVVLSSIRKVAQVSQALGRGLVGSVTWLGLGSVKDDATARLLNFSGFDESALSASALSASALAERAQMGCKPSEAVMAQSLMVVGNCLRADQVSTFTNYRLSIWQKATGHKALFQKTIRQKAIGLWQSFSQLWTKGSDVEGAVVNRSANLKSDLHGQITGLASAVKTRSLQLVIDHRRVWDGLNAQQQSEIQCKIWAFLGAFSNIPKASTSPELSLNPTILRLQKDDPQNEATQKQACSSQLVLQNTVQPVFTFPGQLVRAVLSSPVLQTLKVSKLPALTSAGYAGKDESTFWEVDVVSVDYVEHPLEKLLKWIDRSFLWIEKLWRRIRNWQVSRE